MTFENEVAPPLHTPDTIRRVTIKSMCRYTSCIQGIKHNSWWLATYRSILFSRRRSLVLQKKGYPPAGSVQKKKENKY